MKKLLLFLSVATFVTSCNQNPSNINNSSYSFTIKGITYTDTLTTYFTLKQPLNTDPCLSANDGRFNALHLSKLSVGATLGINVQDLDSNLNIPNTWLGTTYTSCQTRQVIGKAMDQDGYFYQIDPDYFKIDSVVNNKVFGSFKGLGRKNFTTDTTTITAQFSNIPIQQ